MLYFDLEEVDCMFYFLLDLMSSCLLYFKLEYFVVGMVFFYLKLEGRVYVLRLYGTE